VSQITYYSRGHTYIYGVYSAVNLHQFRVTSGDYELQVEVVSKQTYLDFQFKARDLSMLIRLVNTLDFNLYLRTYIYIYENFNYILFYTR
jgi:hypothetical protein